MRFNQFIISCILVVSLLQAGKALAADVHSQSANEASNTVNNATVNLTNDSITSRIVAQLSAATNSAGTTFTPTVPTGGGSTSPTPSNQTSFFNGSAENQRGFAAGDADSDIYVWGSVAGTRVKSELTSTAFEGDIKAAYLGVDTWVTDQVMAGFTLGYARTDVDTEFNIGTFKEDTYSFTPYAAYKINDTFSWSGLVGYYLADVQQERGIGTANYAKSDLDADSLYASTTLTGNFNVMGLDLLGQASYLWSNRDTDGYTESDATVVAATKGFLSQLKVGGEVSYRFESDSFDVTPTLGALYLRDFRDEINGDEDAIEGKLGLEVSSKDGSIITNLEVSNQFARDDFESSTVTGTMRIKF